MRSITSALALSLVLGAPDVRAADPELRFERYRLGNGLTVLLSEDHRLPQVAVDIWYHVGAANQTPGHSGFAHLFEHMMFSGSRHVQPRPFDVLESIGASGVNGTTNFDRTNYFEVVPSAELPTALWLESDRMGYLLDTLDAKKLQIQRDVVSNEKRQNTENRPYGLAQQRVCDLLYPRPHPYYECVIGDIGEIQAASVDDVRSFFQQNYAPNNASLAIVGDFDPRVARELVEKYFGSIPRGPELRVPDATAPPLSRAVRETFVDKLAELPRVVLVWNGVKPYSDEEAAGDVLAEILGAGRTSRLYRSMVFERQAASSVSADDSALGLGGWFSVSATAAEGHGTSELQALVQQAIDAVKRDGVAPDEVQRAQRRIVANLLRSSERIGGRADLLNQYQTFLGDPGYLPRDLARYRAVTPADVQAFARTHLPDDRRIELDIEPQPRAAVQEGQR